MTSHPVLGYLAVMLVVSTLQFIPARYTIWVLALLLAASFVASGSGVFLTLSLIAGVRAALSDNWPKQQPEEIQE
jgi:hypothetical protein